MSKQKYPSPGCLYRAASLIEIRLNGDIRQGGIGRLRLLQITVVIRPLCANRRDFCIFPPAPGHRSKSLIALQRQRLLPQVLKHPHPGVVPPKKIRIHWLRLPLDLMLEI